MLMPIPFELGLLTATILIIALWLSYLTRRDYSGLEGLSRFWQPMEDLISQFAMLMMLATSALQVIVRYSFSDAISIPWTEEAGRLVMVWGTLWGAAALQRTDDHINMSAIFDQLPALGKRVVLIFGDLVIIGLLVPITWWGWENARSLDIMSTISLGLPLSAFAYSVPVTSGLMIIYSFGLLWRRFTGQPIRSSTQPIEI